MRNRSRTGEESQLVVALGVIALLRPILHAPSREAFYRTVCITVLVIVLVLVIRVPFPALPELPALPGLAG